MHGPRPPIWHNAGVGAFFRWLWFLFGLSLFALIVLAMLPVFAILFLIAGFPLLILVLML